MLTTERLDALRAVEAGTVTVRKLGAPGAHYQFTPREMTVDLGFLQRAGLVDLHTEYVKRNGTHYPLVTIRTTERGHRALARVEA